MNRLSALIRCLAQPKRLYKLGVRTGAEERMLIHCYGKAYLDVLDGVLKLWSYNIVQGIHTSVGRLDSLIKGQKCSLQGCQLHKQLYRVHERLAACLYLLTTSTKTSQSQLGVLATRVQLLKLRDLDTCTAGAKSEASAACCST